MTWNLLYVLDSFAVTLFLVSYWRKCYRRGYRVDFWHFNLFLACVFPNLFMLPLARNSLNGIVLGEDFEAVQAVLPAVFLITLVGYFAMLAGSELWRFRLGIGLRKSVMPVLRFPYLCSMMLMSSCKVLVFQAALCLAAQSLILALYFSHMGFGFDLRAYTFANPALRPIALLASNYSIIIGSSCLARYIDKKERILLVCTLMLSFGLVFFGSRANILSIYLTIAICYLVKLRTRVSLSRIIFFASGLILVVLYLGMVRAGQYAIGTFLAGVFLLIFFGNNFSDLRDFAWVYSHWNHVFWAGKTYLAAILAFVPRFASDFRDTWSLGAATAATAGLDPHVHPGLRPGIFGEGYFNFGILGVVFVGLTLGIVMRRVDADIKLAFMGPRPSMMKAAASTTLAGVASNVALSAGFSGLYVLSGILLFSWVCVGVVRLVTSPQDDARSPSF
jgi:oligosaccharide repeat unit polymerase